MKLKKWFKSRNSMKKFDISGKNSNILGYYLDCYNVIWFVPYGKWFVRIHSAFNSAMINKPDYKEL